MSRNRIDATALLAAVVAAGVGFFAPSINTYYITGAIGLTAVLVLLAFDREGYRSAFESVAYSSVIGLCLIIPVSIALQAMGISLNGLKELAVWFVALVVFVAIDRARMAGRVELPTAGSFIRPAPASVARVASAPTAVAPHIYEAPPPPPPTPPVYAPPPPSVVYTPPPPPSAAVIEQPAETPAAVPEQQAPAPSIANFTPPLPPAPVQPPPNAVPVPAGKETMIYVNLMDEGLNVLRSVRAEHLGRDYYKILEEMPAGETWQFGQGQVVRCQKKKLSSGKALVATEEAPRAQ